jgi:transmembrane sensor
MSEKEESLGQVSAKDEEACAWVVRLSSDQRTRQDQARFEQWLEEDEGNASRFDEGLSFWDELGQLGSYEEAHATLGHLYDGSSIQDDEPSLWYDRRALLGSSLAAFAATVAGALVIPKALSGGNVYQTAKGEQRRILLPDGSTLVLDTATRIETSLNDQERVIELINGQAFFDVARDPARPFRVFAGKDEIRALGTAFQVRYERGSTNVVLEEGKIAIFRKGSLDKMAERSPGDRLGAHKADLILEPGQATILVPSRPVKAVPVDLSKTDAWRDGEMVFDDVTLATAAAEVNRYGGPEVVLADSSLAELRISGTFHTNRPEAFVEGVTAALPVRLQQSGGSKLVLTKI